MSMEGYKSAKMKIDVFLRNVLWVIVAVYGVATVLFMCPSFGAIFITITTISSFVLQILCFVFALMGYRKSARKGYLLIATFIAFFYFLVPYTQPLLRQLNDRRMEHKYPVFVQKMQEDERIAAEIDKAIFEVYEREGITVAPAAVVIGERKLLLRLDLLLLAFGLWSLQASERPKHKVTDGGVNLSGVADT